MTDICEDIDLLYNVVMGQLTPSEKHNLNLIVQNRKRVQSALDRVAADPCDTSACFDIIRYAAKGWLKVGDVK